MKFWFDLGVDGFRVDSTPFEFEDAQLRDEPRSYAPGATPRDYKYLNHIYTTDLPETYEMFGSWREYADSYASEHNQDQKVYKVIFCFLVLNPCIIFYRLSRARYKICLF